MAKIRVFPWNAVVYTADSSLAMATAVAHNAVAARIKTVEVVTGDWTTGVTDYRTYPQLGLTAIKATVIHGMGSINAYPISIRGADLWMTTLLIDPLTVDGDSTTIWLILDDAPVYSVFVTFVA